ncbi:glycosyltransferase family 1 protein [Rhodoferax sp.]|uniref:glycosyltransferase family 4 protein n=1 Tax=Rhodoferax sp. TaxID=50421 RepID=UPI00284BBA61|nr:glycosyltransferase family 1 protein [Rhodoferax sp.]MDR3369575.1 glycosyltransferase family 1 protein [Rhodoferax sp.]
MNLAQDLLIESFAPQLNSMRIAVVTETFPPEVNGVAMTLGRIVEGLVCRGHTVQLVRPRQLRETSHPMLNGIEEILSSGLPVPAYADLRFGLPSKRRLSKLWGSHRPDVVHVVTEGPLGWSAIAAARKMQLPVTSSFHTNFQSYSPHYGLGLFKKPIDSYLRKLHNRTQATMVPTRALMQDLQSRGYQNLKLLSRGVASDLFSPTKRSADLRSRWGAGDDDMVVLVVGRLAKEKNLGLVVESFRAIHAHNPAAKMVFVGDGPLRPALQAACPCSIFAGNRQGEDLAAHYASGDLFLFPSLTETYGNVVPEALASGLAVVSYACAAALELITSGTDGMLVSVDSEQEFIDTALSVATQPELLKGLKRSSVKSVAHLAWDTIFDNFIDHLARVIHVSNAGLSADDTNGFAGKSVSQTNA